MPRRPKSPQEKKRLSLAKDRRNAYGENDKASRKNIPRNKALSRRAVRRTAVTALAQAARSPDEHAEVVLSTLSTPRLQKGDWRKCPDLPLGQVIAHKLQRRAAGTGARKRRRRARRPVPR